MPRLDGSGFVELLRLNPEFQSVPVLLVSATYAPEEIAERIGARACLTKPFELDHLIELVGELAGTPTPRTALADSAVIEGLALPEPDALPLGDLAIQLPESNQGI
jgi:CheY-like chemotaxis protein